MKKQTLKLILSLLLGCAVFAQAQTRLLDSLQSLLPGLEGKARLKRGADVLRGSRIVYDIDTGVIKAEKVEGVVQSNDKKSPEK